MADNKRELRVLHITPEMAPLSKRGGLGDVLGALPKTLNRQGVDARVLLPCYPGVLENAKNEGYTVKPLPGRVNIALNWRVYSASVLLLQGKSAPVYVLVQDDLFTEQGIYPDSLTFTTTLPFVFLSLAALELPGCVGWTPHILHAHDWPTALLPAALKWHRYYKGMASNFDVVYTVHNLAHQGIVDPSYLIDWGFESDAYSIQGMEFYGQANLMKGALLTADAVTTVSPHYSWEIQTPDGGFGLNGVFGDIRHKLSGILNGIDYDVWHPKIDRYIPAKFDADDLAGKAVCRKALQEAAGLEADDKPLAAFVGRLVQQKGIDILLSALDWSLIDNCRVVLIGSGSPQYEERVRGFRDSYPGHFYCYTDYSEELAHLAYAGSDILLMPSLFEPCGLSQMISMAYGTIPVVRAAGGLADSVIDFDGSSDGNGFLFSDYSADELCGAMYRAFDAYRDKNRWENVVKNAMAADFSWTSSATRYFDLYNSLRNGDPLSQKG